jgi:hypothetical protein
MKISTLAVVVAVITVTWPFGATLGQTRRHQQAADIPPGLLAALQNDLKNDLEETKSCLDREGLSWDQGVRVTKFNLNRPRQAWFVGGLGPCLAGNANAPIFLYLRDGQDWRNIFYDVGQSLEVCGRAHLSCAISRRTVRRSSRAQGWPDLSLYRHGSAFGGDQLVYRFDGNAYKAVACKMVDYANSASGKRYSKPRYRACPLWRAREERDPD